MPSGTKFYVPIQGIDNTPPVLGTFPTTVEQARDYVFSPDANGASFEVTVDGKTTELNPQYVSLLAPVRLPNDLVDHLNNDLGAGIDYGFIYQSATVGVFLSPMSVGTHTVTIHTTIDGAFFLTYYNPPYTGFETTFTYTVNVVPAH